MRGLGERRHVDQRTDQSQQRLLFRSIACTQEVGQLDVRQLAAGRRVGLVNDEGVAVRRLAPKKLAISVRAAVKFSSVRHWMRSPKQTK